MSEDTYPNEAFVTDMMSKSDAELIGFLAKESKHDQRVAAAILESRARDVVRAYTRYTLAIAIFTAVAALASLVAVCFQSCNR